MLFDMLLAYKFYLMKERFFRIGVNNIIFCFRKKFFQ